MKNWGKEVEEVVVFEKVEDGWIKMGGTLRHYSRNPTLSTAKAKIARGKGRLCRFAISFTQDRKWNKHGH